MSRRFSLTLSLVLLVWGCGEDESAVPASSPDYATPARPSYARGSAPAKVPVIPFEEVAAEAGIDFVIQGNDIPLWCFDWPRPESLHMVSTEFAPGWNLIGGPRGLGLPPTGRISPIVKMARRHARSRFVHLWYYLDQPYEKYHGNAPLGRVLSYELLAHHAMIQAYPSQAKVAGTVESHREVADFIHAAKETWGDREPLARIALLYSPDSRLTGITPGAVNEFAAQRHVFDLIGWGTALSEFHAQYDVIAEWEDRKSVV